METLDFAAKLDRLEELLMQLVERHTIKDWYSIEEAASLLRKAEFTIREWCRLGRVHAKKQNTGRGAHASWVVSNDEILRYRREGLLPDRRQTQTS